MTLTKKTRRWLCGVLTCGSLVGGGLPAQAAATTLPQQGHVTVEDSGTSPLVDPEHPTETVTVEDSAHTEGALRFDYVSALDFGSVAITSGDRVCYALAQTFTTDTTPRGTYLQITDRRATQSGWSLQVKQETQFTTQAAQKTDQRELTGAVLSLDRAWANSAGTSGTPTVTRDTIAITALQTAYTVATADKTQGKGVWLIEFGASETNVNHQPVTLEPLTLPDGTKSYANSAVQLQIPGSVSLTPDIYTTTLTWWLTSAP